MLINQLFEGFSFLISLQSKGACSVHAVFLNNVVCFNLLLNCIDLNGGGFIISEVASGASL